MTPKEREVMEQALEALESCDSDYDWDGDGDEYQVDVYDRDKVNKAITAIKAALEAHKALMYLQDEAQQSGSVSNEQVKPAFWYRNEDIFGNQEMEPIFYATKAWDNCLPLYTHPQRTAAEGEDTLRAWVGLTKDQMLEILREIDPETQRLPIGFRMFADAIEAKLKEKNT